MDEHMNDKLLVIRSKNKPFDLKMDTLEWLSRYANFYPPENVYLMIAAFKELYSGPDVNYRNSFITSKHTSDAGFLLISTVRAEFVKPSQASPNSKTLGG